MTKLGQTEPKNEKLEIEGPKIKKLKAKKLRKIVKEEKKLEIRRLKTKKLEKVAKKIRSLLLIVFLLLLVF